MSGANVSFRRARASDRVIDLDNFNRMEMWLERVCNMAVDSHFYLRTEPTFALGLLQSSTTSLDLSKFLFGMTYSGAVATIAAGEVHHGTRGIIDVSGSVITITLDQSYVWIEYGFGGGVASIFGPSPTRPVSDAATYRKWLYLFTLTAGVITDYKIGHVGAIDIPGSYA